MSLHRLQALEDVGVMLILNRLHVGLHPSVVAAQLPDDFDVASQWIIERLQQV